MSHASTSRLLALSALLVFLPAGAGCEIHAGQFVKYRRGDDEYPKPGAPEVETPRAPKKNDLVAGVRKFRLSQLPAGAAPDDTKEAGDPKDVGRDFSEALLDAKIFKEVHYPLRDQTVDVEIEPIVTFGIKKNGLTNFLKLFPCLILPWVDGFGFDYDHTYVLELVVRDGRKPDVVCDRFRKEVELTAERYPSIFWFAGLHASLFVLLILETATTDELVVRAVIEKNAHSVQDEAMAWLIKEFSPGARACPLHPKVSGSGTFCVVCGANLRYPILNRVEQKPPKEKEKEKAP